MSKTIGVVIVVFLLLVEVTLGQSVAMPDNALQDLKSTHLNRANLSIYEEQAVLKLKDVLDYVTIVGSQKYNRELRETVLETMLSNFDETAKLSCTWLLENKDHPSTRDKLEAGNGDKDKNSCTAKELFQGLLDKPSYELEIGAQNIKVEESLRKISKETYQGELVYEQQIKTKKNKNTPTFKEGKQKTIRIQFLLKRIDKQFGSTTEVVWDIKFLTIP
jgi:hypothetical protein